MRIRFVILSILVFGMPNASVKNVDMEIVIAITVEVVVHTKGIQIIGVVAVLKMLMDFVMSIVSKIFL